MVKNPSPDPPFISQYAIIQNKMGLFLTFSVFELQRGYLWGRISPESDWCWFKLVLRSSSLLLRGYMDLSPAVGHVRECPHSGTRYSNSASSCNTCMLILSCSVSWCVSLYLCISVPWSVSLYPCISVSWCVSLTMWARCSLSCCWLSL